MPPKPTIEDEFDDDTDFALPTPPPATGAGGPPIMPQMTPQQMQAFQQMMAGGGAGPSAAGAAGGMPSIRPTPRDLQEEEGDEDPANSESKQWITLYPIYFDAKRSHKVGERRVNWQHASLFPHSFGIAKSVSRLNLLFAHEPAKTHPRDWENPGRVKVKLMDTEGNKVHSKIQNRKQLIKAVAPLLQEVCGGPPPLELPKREKKVKTSGGEKKGKGTTDGKTDGQKAAKASSRDTSTSTGTSANVPPFSAGSSTYAAHRYRVKLLQPYMPPPSIRLPPHSPALSADLLNMDLNSAMGGGKGPGAGEDALGGANPMGALGSMMGNLGFGQEGEEDAAGEQGADAADAKAKHDPFKGMGRRGRKRVVRVGR